MAALPAGYKIAIGGVLVGGFLLLLWQRRQAAGDALPAPAGTANPAWGSPPASAGQPSAPVTRPLTTWEKSVLGQYFRADLLAAALIHIGQWSTSPSVADGVEAVTSQRDIWIKNPSVVFTDPYAMSILAHELFHVAEFATGMTDEQYAEGKAAAAAGKPWTNPFEAPAYQMGQQVFQDLTGVQQTPLSGCACSSVC